MSDQAIKVVYLENDLDMIEIISRALSQQGFQVVSAASGCQSLAKIEEMEPDLVILGLMTPTTDNWEVHWQIRGSERMKNIPILLITSKSQRYDGIPGLISTPLDDYIPYPFKSSLLLTVVRELLDRAGVSY